MTKQFFIILLEGCPFCDEAETILKRTQTKYNLDYRSLTISRANKAVHGPLIMAITAALKHKLVTYPQTYIMDSTLINLITTTPLADISISQIQAERNNVQYIGTCLELKKFFLEQELN